MLAESRDPAFAPTGGGRHRTEQNAGKPCRRFARSSASNARYCVHARTAAGTCPQFCWHMSAVLPAFCPQRRGHARSCVHGRNIPRQCGLPQAATMRVGVQTPLVVRCVAAAAHVCKSFCSRSLSTPCVQSFCGMAALRRHFHTTLWIRFHVGISLCFALLSLFPTGIYSPQFIHKYPFSNTIPENPNQRPPCLRLHGIYMSRGAWLRPARRDACRPGPATLVTWRLPIKP